MSLLKFSKDLNGFQTTNVMMTPSSSSRASEARQISRNCLDLGSIEHYLKKSKLEDRNQEKVVNKESIVGNGTLDQVVQLFDAGDASFEEDFGAQKLLEKCLEKKDLKDLSVLRLSGLLMKCYCNNPDVWLGDSDIAIWSYGTSPEEFYLKWEKNLDQFRLLSLWLSDVVGSEEDCEEVSRVAVHQIFAVEFDVDKGWYRGEVVRILTEDVVEVLFIDYGRVERCYLDQLRRLPAELLQVPRYAFKCKLLDVDPVDCIQGGDLLRFRRKLKSTRRIRCGLVGLLKECAGFCVQLWDEDSPCWFSSMLRRSGSEENDLEDDCVMEPLLDHLPLEEEASLLIHGVGELQLPSHPAVLPKGYDCYRIEEAVDPAEIYVWDQSNPEEETVDRHQVELNHFYSNPQWLEAYRIQTTRVFLNRPYAWRNKERRCWERVIVVRTDMPAGQVFVQRLDFGSKLLVDIEDMMELSPRFCTWPSKVQLAHLVHVKPKDGAQHWKFRICRKFRALVNLGNIHIGTVFSREGSSYKVDSEHRTWKSLGLVMIYADERLPYSLQSILVSLGLAEGTGIGAGHPFLPFVEQGSPNYCSSRGRCRRSSLNNSEDILSERTILHTLKFPYSVVGNLEDPLILAKIGRRTEELHQDFLPQYIRICLGWVRFTHTKTPSHFYIQMRHKKSEFGQMTQDLSELIQHDPMDFAAIKPGLFVAVFFVHEEYSEFAPTWNRAFVYSTNPALQNAHVILIDYGIETIVKFKLIRELPEAFRDVLPYCRRAHLRLPDVAPTGSLRWSEDARCNFVAYIQAWSSHSPVYLAYQQEPSKGVVYLEDFEQELIYCRQSKDWIASPLGPRRGGSSKYEILSKFKTDKILQHLFRSVPLLIYYEVSSNSESFYTYQPVWDNLIENGFLMKCR